MKSAPRGRWRLEGGGLQVDSDDTQIGRARHLRTRRQFVETIVFPSAIPIRVFQLLVGTICVARNAVDNVADADIIPGSSKK
ncbi:MAG: hypothetical protein AAF928_04975 [Myxococcota bacterium]